MGQWRIIYQNPETARGRSVDLELPGVPGGEWSLGKARAQLLTALSRCIKDRRVVDAIAAVPRELFVPPEHAHLAYQDAPLPIGEGQTISQPLMVAVMTEALQLRGHETVLEVGTGSGYHAAVLSRLAARVISVERKEKLLHFAQRRLAALKIDNVELHLSSNHLGWPAKAPYEAIIVTAGAPPRIPPSLTAQLEEGGRMIIPSGGRQRQELLRATKREGRIIIDRLGSCGFVPLIGEEGWDEGA